MHLAFLFDRGRTKRKLSQAHIRDEECFCTMHAGRLRPLQKPQKRKSARESGVTNTWGVGAACNSAAMPCKVNGGIRLAEAKSIRGGGPQYQPQSDRKRLEMMLLKKRGSNRIGQETKRVKPMNGPRNKNRIQK